MSRLTFAKATKKAARLRLALVGPSGTGKTYSALRIARGLAGPSGRIAVVDTERGSASKYADQFEFDALDLETFAPETYIQAIRAADAAGYTVLIIDSLTHAWSGKDGALEQVDKAAKRSQSGNSFAAWREVTPRHNEMVDTILQARLHIIATMRVKTEYIMQDNGKGKVVPKKVGMAPIQRDGLEYEFDVVGTLTHDNDLIIDKTRCPLLHAAVINLPGEELGQQLAGWLSDGVAPPPPVPPAVERAMQAVNGPTRMSQAQAMGWLKGMSAELGVSIERIAAAICSRALTDGILKKAPPDAEKAIEGAVWLCRNREEWAAENAEDAGRASIEDAEAPEGEPEAEPEEAPAGELEEAPAEA